LGRSPIWQTTAPKNNEIANPTLDVVRKVRFRQASKTSAAMKMLEAAVVTVDKANGFVPKMTTLRLTAANIANASAATDTGQIRDSMHVRKRLLRLAAASAIIVRNNPYIVATSRCRHVREADA
jgi:hypothetical protein